MAEADELRERTDRVLAALTPHPHRGDLIAAGAVPLALGVLLVNVRLDAQWGDGVFLVLNALACALVLGMGLLAPLEGERPRSYQQVLLLAGVALGFTALLRLAQVLGSDVFGSSGTASWVFGTVTVGSAAIARWRRSAVCALVGALAGIVTVLSFVDWVFSPEGAGTTRWILLLLATGLVLTALARRDVRRRESVYLIDAAGVAIVILALTFAGALIGPLAGFVGLPGAVPGSGWKLVLLAAGLGLVAYAAVDREAGPAYLGTLVLLLFVLFAGIPGEDGASLWFWPLVLLLVGGVGIAAGLRPRHPLPPEPPGAGADAPTEPVPGPGAGGASAPLWAKPSDDA